MQVMICLGNAYGTHTGLRLIDAGNHVLFWDPAGHYGIGTVEIPRRRDVIDEDAPTLAQYVKWRIKGARDDTVVVYEWGLSTRRADELRAILSGDPTRTPGGEAFDTTTIGLFCCKAVCEFLDRFASPEITVPEYWFRPEHLGKHLWTQQPTRVLIYRANAPTQIWLPDSDR